MRRNIVKGKTETEVLIIGQGITGASIARELSRYKIDVIGVEKSPDSVTGQTKGGHGLVYSGRSLVMAFSLVLKSIMAPGEPLWHPETLKIRLATEGYELFGELAERLDILYKPTKFLIVARNEVELKSLKGLVDICELMGIKDYLTWMDKADILDMEPNLTDRVIAGVYEDKLTRSIFPPEYVFANVENAKENGVHFAYGAEVKGIKALDGGFSTETESGVIESKFVVNAGGLYADKVADMAGARDDWSLTHNRTQMVLLDRRLRDIFKTITCIHAAPSPGFLEAIQIQVHGNPYVFCGAYYPAEGKESTGTKKEWFIENLNKGRDFCPGISDRDVIASFVGVRAFNTRNLDDHIIEFSKKQPRFLNVVVRLPGFSVAAAVAKYVVNLLGNEGLPLAEKADYNGFRKEIPRFVDLSNDERDALIQKDARYGHVVCRCETVTEGEIVEAIRRGARTVQGIQFRTRAGMGRCQKGFCGPRIVEILSRELGIPKTEVKFKGRGSEILKYRSKELLQTGGGR
jgi:glycerol-3-phosphate dehydrogenase